MKNKVKNINSFCNNDSSYNNSIIVKVAVGLILNSQNQILIAQRPSHKEWAGLWEFPGGKIEPYESAVQALKRELLEELSIVIKDPKKFLNLEFDYPDYRVQLEIFWIHHFDGIASGLEGQFIHWVEIESLEKFTFLDANKEIIKKIIKFIRVTN